MNAPVPFVLKGWPRLSETFIAQEIKALEDRGVDIRIISLRRPADRGVHALNRAVRAPVLYLPEYLHTEPLRVLRAWAWARSLPGYGLAKRVWRGDLKRDRSRSRRRRFGQAMVLAAEGASGVAHIHAHFLHTPASVARYAALMLGLPWSVSAHAKDIWTTPEWELSEKLADAAWCVTCTHAGAERLRALAPASGAVDLLYHGLDFTRFPETPPSRPLRDGGDAADPVRVLSVGRAVEKKGYDGLLRALAALPSTLHWRFEHIGGGADLKKLKAQAEQLGLAGRIQWRGALTQDEVIKSYRAADVFVLNARVAADGDRDGLPNVLMEAQANGLVCLAAHVSAVPELIEHGVTGVLTPPDDAPRLSAALADLMTDPGRRARLGEAGRLRVRGAFGMSAGVDELARRFTGGRVLGASHAEVAEAAE
ncbi:MAG: glycosyltransferase family 4 protein [Rhodospirillales bacterium]